MDCGIQSSTPIAQSDLKRGMCDTSQPRSVDPEKTRSTWREKCKRLVRARASTPDLGTCVHTHLKRFNAATRVRRVGGRGRERRLGDPGSTAADKIARRRRRRRRRCRLLRPIPERLPRRSKAPACARPWSEPACTLRPAGFKLKGVGGLKEEVLIVRHGGAECKGARGLASQRGGTRGPPSKISTSKISLIQFNNR